MPGGGDIGGSRFSCKVNVNVARGGSTGQGNNSTLTCLDHDAKSSDTITFKFPVGTTFDVSRRKATFKLAVGKKVTFNW